MRLGKFLAFLVSFPAAKTVGCSGHTKPEERTNAQSHAVAVLLCQGCWASRGGTRAEPFLNCSLLPDVKGLRWHGEGEAVHHKGVG